MKQLNQTASQAAILTAPFSGTVDPQKLEQLAICTKYGTPFSEELKDIKERGNGVLVINLASDDRQAGITEFLAETQKERLCAAIEALRSYCSPSEVIIVRPKKIAFSCGEAREIETERCLVLREESALYHLIETGELRSCPLEKAFVSEGYRNRPTVMCDAETLARIAALCGSGSFEETKLIAIRTPEGTSVGEFRTGTPLLKIAEEAGIITEKSILLGGLTGKFVGKKEEEAGLKVGTEALWDFIGFYGKTDCMAALTAELAGEAREETCQKCVLCREGTWHFKAIFDAVTAGRAKNEDLAIVQDIGPLIHVGAFCSFGRSMAELFTSSVVQNRAELEAHFLRKTCPAGVCRAFSKPVIDPEKCTGCTDCLDVCDEEAIEGKKGFIHIIDPDMCENCGKCQEVCEEGAIVIQDGSIKVPKKLIRAGKS